jgi:hypothetical protein
MSNTQPSRLHDSPPWAVVPVPWLLGSAYWGRGYRWRLRIDPASVVRLPVPVPHCPVACHNHLEGPAINPKDTEHILLVPAQLGEPGDLRINPGT